MRLILDVLIQVLTLPFICHGSDIDEALVMPRIPPDAGSLIYSFLDQLPEWIPTQEAMHYFHNFVGHIAISILGIECHRVVALFPGKSTCSSIRDPEIFQNFGWKITLLLEERVNIVAERIEGSDDVILRVMANAQARNAQESLQSAIDQHQLSGLMKVGFELHLIVTAIVMQSILEGGNIHFSQMDLLKSVRQIELIFGIQSLTQQQYALFSGKMEQVFRLFEQEAYAGQITYLVRFDVGITLGKLEPLQFVSPFSILQSPWDITKLASELVNVPTLLQEHQGHLRLIEDFKLVIKANFVEFKQFVVLLQSIVRGPFKRVELWIIKYQLWDFLIKCDYSEAIQQLDISDYFELLALSYVSAGQDGTNTIKQSVLLIGDAKDAWFLQSEILRLPNGILEAVDKATIDEELPQSGFDQRLSRY
ncbi:hypothetical protein MIR68_010378 [Amoeboaphelidium protococcarum]|nr:hypothetical protein MIR68_010378 [Amoeboaphelidium protococcarum]